LGDEHVVSLPAARYMTADKRARRMPARWCYFE
jgi:hypothetical protein